jgi:hypothetical protein
MAGSIPNKDKGIIATVDAHVLGQTIDAIGGYFTSMTVGAGGTISPSLDSKVKGPSSALKCAAFFTRLWVENNTILFVDLLVDTTTIGGTNAAGTLSSMIRKEQQRIAFTGMVGAYHTTDENGGADVLKQVNIQGQIWRSKDGTLHLDDCGETSFGQSHHLQMFRVGILPDKSTDLQLNFGGQANGVWTVGPLTS